MTDETNTKSEDNLTAPSPKYDSNGRDNLLPMNHGTEYVPTALSPSTLLGIHTYGDGMSALHIAVREGSIPMISLLLCCDISVDAPNTVGQTPLHLAVLRNQPQVIELLVAAGADPNFQDVYGRRPLHLACQLGHLAVARLLLPSNSVADALEAKDFEGSTPLHLAISHGHVELVKLLLQNGADVRSRRII